MRHPLTPLLAALALAAPAAAAGLDGPLEGSLHAFLGAKHLDGDDWDPDDNHVAFGAIGDLAPRGWWLRPCIGLIGSFSETDQGGVETWAETWELQIGGRATLPLGPAWVAVAGGASLVDGYVEVESAGVKQDDDDIAPGLWVSLAIGATVWRRLDIGLLLTWSHAPVELLGTDRDAGGLAWGALIGARW